MVTKAKRKRASWGEGRENIVAMRLTESERGELERMAEEAGYKTLSAFLRAHLFSETVSIDREIKT